MSDFLKINPLQWTKQELMDNKCILINDMDNIKFMQKLHDISDNLPVHLDSSDKYVMYTKTKWISVPNNILVSVPVVKIENILL